MVKGRDREWGPIVFVVVVVSLIAWAVIVSTTDWRDDSPGPRTDPPPRVETRYLSVDRTVAGDERAASAEMARLQKQGWTCKGAIDLDDDGMLLSNEIRYTCTRPLTGP